MDDIPWHSFIVNEENLTIPLKLNGIISYFEGRTPTINEVENCPHIILTSAEEWNPYSSHFTNRESEVVNTIKISAIYTEYMEYSDRWLLQESTLSLVKLDRKHLFIQEQQLATIWGIGVKDATSTLKAMMQSFIRSALHPIERRFKTKNVTLRYNQLKCRFYSDTFFSGVKSLLQNTCVQLFVTDFGYIKFSPIGYCPNASPLQDAGR